MTDKAGALALLANTPADPAFSKQGSGGGEFDNAERAAALAAFDESFRSHREAIDAWFTVQSSCGLPGVRGRLEALMKHPAFEITNPNKVRCVFSLATAAPDVLFEPSVLELLGDVATEIDATNPNLCSGLIKQLAQWRRLPEGPVRDAARKVLERVRDREGCSKNAGEVASAALA
jgi:aminopeptidase N